MRVALSQAKASAAIITPINTARARLCTKIVTSVTVSITKTSIFGNLVNALKLAHSKVPIDTINISPTSAAIGTCSIRLLPYITKISRVSDAIIPAIRVLAPFDTLIRLCPIIAHPPIPEKNPEVIFAAHCAIASLLLFPCVPVISSTILRVKRLSIKPTAATIQAYGKIICKVSKLKGRFGIWKGGKFPEIELISPTLTVSIPRSITTAKVLKIATSEAGTIFVSFGSPQMISIVKVTSPIMMSRGAPVIQTLSCLK